MDSSDDASRRPCTRTVVRVLLSGCEAYDDKFRTRCRKALLGMGAPVYHLITDVIADKRMDKKRRKELLEFALQVSQQVPAAAPERIKNILDVLFSFLSRDQLFEEVQDVLRDWPGHGVSDHLIARAIAVGKDDRRCGSILRQASHYGPPSAAAVSQLAEVASSNDPRIVAAVELLSSMVGLSRSEATRLRFTRFAS